MTYCTTSGSTGSVRMYIRVLSFDERDSCRCPWSLIRTRHSSMWTSVSIMRLSGSRPTHHQMIRTSIQPTDVLSIPQTVLSFTGTRSRAQFTCYPVSCPYDHQITWGWFRRIFHTATANLPFNLSVPREKVLHMHHKRKAWRGMIPHKEVFRTLSRKCGLIEKKERGLKNQKILTHIFEIRIHITIYFSFSYLSQYPGFNN